MNRALRVIVPIILVLAVIGCTAWYLLVYDRDFTQDFLLQQARNFEESGNHKISAWLYGVAYQQSSKEPQVAIELAEQYAKDLNYTKAEYTLTKAISETGDAALYAKLCQIYVAQDKLLDAVTMLNTIANQSVKETLDAMRPAAPVLTPTPGFYNQYISVSPETTANDVYLSTNDEYPTISRPYTGPIPLEAGETTVYALAVGDNGLVSTLTVGGYTVGGIVELIEFSDAAMEAEIRKILMIADSTPIYSDDLWTIESFVVPEDAISCEDLKYLPHLRSLKIPNTTTTDLSLLAELDSLEELQIIDSDLGGTEMAAIGKLTGLTQLTLHNCSITSLNSLQALTKLVYLDLSENTVRNISALSDMKDLKTLNLESNAISDVSPLAALTQLTVLNLTQNAITSIEPLSRLTLLNELRISHNQLSSLAPLSGMSGLRVLEAANNTLTDASALGECISLTELALDNNALTEVNALSTLVNLTNLTLAYNQITELPAFSEDCNLVIIDASHNQLKSLAQLSVLQRLNEVHVDYNKDIKSLEPLDSCELLILVNAYGTSVTEVKFLTDKSVIVNFDPTV